MERFKICKGESGAKGSAAAGKLAFLSAAGTTFARSSDGVQSDGVSIVFGWRSHRVWIIFLPLDRVGAIFRSRLGRFWIVCSLLGVSRGFSASVLVARTMVGLL